MRTKISVFAAVTAIALAGCATTSSVAKGPNGRPLHHIESITAGKGYERASEKCPNGYDLLTDRQQGVFFIIDIECK